MDKHVSGFAEYQEEVNYGLDYKLTLTRNRDEAVLDKAAGIADARNQIDHIHWYKAQITSSIQEEGTLSKQILSKTPTELRYFERSVFMKKKENSESLEIWIR